MASFFSREALLEEFSALQFSHQIKKITE